jgi:2-C-methyl-D-erythritol 4-phosphate cytidylyltransferase
MTRVAAIVLGAGTGRRFGGAKQFAEVAPGLRLVDVAIRSVRPFAEHITLVLPAGASWAGDEVEEVVTGGRTRLHSAANGLAVVPSGFDVVIVHDTAHPMAPPWMFEEGIRAVAAGADAAVPMLHVWDVVKRIEPETGYLATAGRDDLGLAQPPMAFAADALRRAHFSPGDLDLWEDSMLIERAGGRVIATRGWKLNIHVVDEDDLEMVRLLAPLRDRLA